MHVYLLSHIKLLATLWTVACQAPLSMGFPRQEYWRGCHFLLQGLLPYPEIELKSPAVQKDSSPLSHQPSPVVVSIC